MEQGNKKRSKRLSYLLIGFFTFKMLGVFLARKKKKQAGRLEKNFIEYLKEEEVQIRKYTRHKIGLAKFAAQSAALLKSYFIPSESNGHHPKILHSRSLAVIVAAAFLLKFCLAAYVFLINPFRTFGSENISDQVLAMVNRDRVSSGLTALSPNAALCASAQAKADDMIANDYFAHYSPDGRKPWDFIDRGQYAYLFVGENLAMNFSSAESAHQALMLSSAHKSNILSDKYSDVGIAVARGELNGRETAVLVQLFAVRQAPAVTTDKKIAGSTELAEDTAVKIASAAHPVPVSAPAMTPKIEETRDTAPVSPADQAESIEPLQSEPDALPSAGSDSPQPIEEVPAPEPAADAPGAPAFEPPAPEPLPEIPGIGAAKEPDTALDMEKNLNGNERFFENIPAENSALQPSLIGTANGALLAVMGLIFALLVINIIIRFEYRHRHAYLSAIFAVVFLIGMIYFNFSFMENILPKLTVL